MSRIRFFTYSIVLFAFLSVGKGFGQDCYEQAKKAYEEGKIDQVQELLKPCFQGKVSRIQKTEAYRLLTLTHLYFNDQDSATFSMTQLLRNEPEYKLREKDPTEFVNLYNTFRTTPILLVGAKFGTNFLDVDVKKHFSVSNSDIARGEYKSKVGIQGGFLAEFPLSRKVSILGEVLYSTKSFLYKDDTLFGYASLEFPEKQTHIEVPVLFNFNFPILSKSKDTVNNLVNKTTTKFVPYVNIGGSVSYLFGATASPIRKDRIDENNQREVNEGDQDIKSLRSTLNYNLLLGGGLKIKDVLGRGYLFFDFRYSYGLNNIVNPEKRYSNNDLVYKYLYIDNDIKINSFQYTVGYSYPLYKPKVKKKKKSKEDNI